MRLSCRTGRLRLVTPQTKTCLWGPRGGRSLRDAYTLVRFAICGLEVVGDVAGGYELGLFCAQVVGGEVVGVLEANLGAEEDCAADPVTVADEMLGVFGGVAGALAFDVVDELVAN